MPYSPTLKLFLWQWCENLLLWGDRGENTQKLTVFRKAKEIDWPTQELKQDSALSNSVLTNWANYQPNSQMSS